MSKTNKPLVVIALPPCNQWPELEKLEAKGHQVIRFGATDKGFSSNLKDHEDLLRLIAEADIVIGARTWRMDHKHRSYLTLALKQVRLVKFGEPKRKKWGSQG